MTLQHSSRVFNGSLLTKIGLDRAVAILAQARETMRFRSALRARRAVGRTAPGLLRSATATLAVQCGDRFDERLHWLLSLTDENLACYNCSFDPAVQWANYSGPCCMAIAS